MNIGIIASQAQSNTGDPFIPEIVNLPLNVDGGWYYPYVTGTTPHPTIAAIKPGSIIQITSDVSYALLYGLKGTLERPIKIVPVGGPWRFYQGGASYGMNIQVEHVIIDGGPDKNLIFGAESSEPYSPQTLTLNNSTNWVVRNCIIEHGQVGILANPSTGPNMYDVLIEDNIIRDMQHPGATCEGIYLGNTSLQSITGTHFENLIIRRNDLDDIGGDGIQVSNAQNYHIYDNTIDNYGTGNVPDQRTGIIIGSSSWGTVEDNIVTFGTGGGLQCFGTGINNIQNNIFTDVAQAANTDAIYIRKNGIDGDPLQPNVLNNQFLVDTQSLVATRHGIMHQAFPPRTTTPGTWSGNTFEASVGGLVYRSEVTPIDNITP